MLLCIQDCGIVSIYCITVPSLPSLSLSLPSTLASAALCKCTKYCISHTSSDLTSILQLTF